MAPRIKLRHGRKRSYILCKEHGFEPSESCDACSMIRAYKAGMSGGDLFEFAKKVVPDTRRM